MYLSSDSLKPFCELPLRGPDLRLFSYMSSREVFFFLLYVKRRNLLRSPADPYFCRKKRRNFGRKKSANGGQHHRVLAGPLQFPYALKRRDAAPPRPSPYSSTCIVLILPSVATSSKSDLMTTSSTPSGSGALLPYGSTRVTRWPRLEMEEKEKWGSRK